MSRAKRAEIAKQTISICERGEYVNSHGQAMDTRLSMEESIRGTATYSPAALDALRSSVDMKLTSLKCKTKFFVENATTFATARAIVESMPAARVLCLNFASAKNAGGGFIGGSQAQEEALCRASGLYACINPHREYYDTNRACGTALYTDYMIYSPSVPVFRDDNDELLDSPYDVSIVTAPAVNAGVLANSQPEKLAKVAPVMLERIAKLLSIAVERNYSHLVLGAWGCGVFRNESSEIAALFRSHLVGDGRFAKAFEAVHFGVLDYAKDTATFSAFANEFADETSLSHN